MNIYKTQGPGTNKEACCTHLLGQGARLLGGVEDFVVEDGEVEGQAQPDGVRRLHVLLADVEGVLVGLLRVLHRICSNKQTNKQTNNQRSHEPLILLRRVKSVKHRVSMTRLT